jgi:hypothetical protein
MSKRVVFKIMLFIISVLICISILCFLLCVCQGIQESKFFLNKNPQVFSSTSWALGWISAFIWAIIENKLKRKSALKVDVRS